MKVETSGYRFDFFCIFCGKPVDPRGPTSCQECRSKLKETGKEGDAK